MNSSFKHKLLIGLALLVFLAGGAQTGAAQETEPEGPVYIVAEGDTLSSIALQFGVTVDDLVAFNGLSDANSLFIGDRLVIPGLAGITGILETADVAAGESLRGLSRRYRIPMDLFVRLNRLVSPAELYVGAPLVLTRSQGLTEPRRVLAPAGASTLEIAVRTGANPWAISEWNGYLGQAEVHPGDVLYLDGPASSSTGGLHTPPESFRINRLFQGEAAVIAVPGTAAGSVQGRLGPYTLAFVDGETGSLSLQGIHALLDPQLLPLQLTISFPDGATYGYTQYVRMYGRDYIFETISVPPELVDTATNEAEFATLLPLLETVSPEKHWDGVFSAPSPFEDCINSSYGNRRSYNGSAFIYYHSGVDFCGGTGVEIYAPADGVVVYTGFLDVRGNFTLIDHGWGILTAYLHQSEILVETGDRVTTGQVIGLVGTTGRSTGPHLHWEVWVHAVAVNPLDWLVEAYP